MPIPAIKNASGNMSKHTTAIIRPAEKLREPLKKRLLGLATDKAIIPPKPVPAIATVAPTRELINKPSILKKHLALQSFWPSDKTFETKAQFYGSI